MTKPNIFEQCTQCHETVNGDVRYCTHCGSLLGSKEEGDIVEQARHYVSQAAQELAETGKEAMETELGKKMAGGAAIGALAGAPIPIVGWFAGALAGAGIVAYRHRNRDEAGKDDDPKE
jgi:hypothetical protein